MTNPIVETEPRFLIDCDKMICNRHIKLKKMVNKMKIKKTINESCCNPWRCLKEYFKGSNFESQYIKTDECNQRFITCLQTSLENFMIPSNHYKGKLHTFTFEENVIRLRKLCYQKIVVEEIKNRICYTKIIRGEIFKIDDHLYVEPDVFIFDCKNHRISIGNTTILLATMDNIQGYFTTYLYTLTNFEKKNLFNYLFITSK